MVKNSIKALLVATFSLFMILFYNVSEAQDPSIANINHYATHYQAAKEDEKLNPAKIIKAHIRDSHEFHFFAIGDHVVSIPLPVIVYTPTLGFDFFSSAKFGEDEGDNIYDGYGLDENKHIVRYDGLKAYDFSITKNVIQMFLALTFLVVIMISIANKYATGQGLKTAPTGLQNAIEPIITFVRDDVARPNLGKKADKYLPYLLTVFFFILINNLFSLIPASANVTGNMSFTIVLGIISFIVILFSTNRHFWAHIFWPPGIPFLVKIILVPIELAGVLLIKPAALIIRLFANMIAGHIIILSFILLIFIFGGMATVAGYGFSPLSVAFAVFIYCIEILVAFIQAFIFANLTAVFIGQSLEGEGHGNGNGHDDAVIA